MFVARFARALVLILATVLLPVVFTQVPASAAPQEIALVLESPYYPYANPDNGPQATFRAGTVFLPKDGYEYRDYSDPNNPLNPWIVTVDQTDNKIVYQCSALFQTSCGVNFPREEAPTPHTYQSFVVLLDQGEETDGATLPLNGDRIVAESNTAQMGWRPFRTSLKMTRTWNNGGDVEVEPKVNQTVYGSGYVLAMYDTTTGGLPIVSCDHGVGDGQARVDLNCGSRSLLYTLERPLNHEYAVAVVKPNTAWADVEPLAVSTPVTPSVPYVGPSTAEISGGSTDSQNCSQKCVGDPVNSFTGAFYDSAVDMAIGGRGPGITATRSYSTGRASVNGPFGFGSAFSYDMAATSDPVTGQVTVREENGNQTTFTPKTGGGFEAPSRVLASLTSTSGGGWEFERNGGRTTFEFDSAGRLVSVTDANGEAVTLTYNAGVLSTIEDASGRTVDVTWTNGRITSLSDDAGRTVAYTYTTGGELQTVTDVRNKTTTFTYNAAHRQLTKTDPRGGVLTNTYDTSGRIATQVDPENATTTFAYATDPGNPDYKRTIITDPRTNKIAYYFLGGALVSETRAYGISLQASTWDYTRDPDTLGVTSVVDPNGAATYTKYNGQGQVTSTTNEQGATTAYTRNADGQALTVTDPLDTVTTYDYDSRGNLTSMSTPLNASTTASQTFTYGNATHPGDVTATTDARGKTTTFGYDSHGDVNSITDPLGHQTTIGRDSLGRKTSAVSPRGNVTGGTPANHTSSWTYDAAGNVLTETNARGKTTAFTYDNSGNRSTVETPQSQVTTTTYDLMNRPKNVTAPDQTVTKTRYDATGNVLEQEDAAGLITTYIYDAQNQMKRITDPLLKATRFNYDAAGHRVSVIDALTKTTTTEYDRAGRPTAVYYGIANTPDASWTYDDAGRAKSMTDRYGTTTYDYDALGRRTAAKNINGTGKNIGYEYNLNSQPTKITYPDGESVTRGYDDAGRWTSATDWAGDQFGFTYDPDGTLTGQTNPNGVEATVTPDNAGSPTSITWKKGSTTVADFGYTRNNNGQVNQAVATGATAVTEDYGYTSKGQIDSVNTSPYTWNASGAPTALPDGTTMTYDNGNRALTSTKAGVTTNYAYNNNGARTTVNGTVVHTYDQANRLIRNISAGVTTNYTYDGNGLRASKKVGTAAIKMMQWDTTANLPMLLADGTNRYMYGPGGRLIEQKPLASATGAQFPLTDALGTIQGLTDSAGTVSGRSTYNASGKRLTTTGAVTPFGFAGEYRDNESGYVYLRARHYDPNTAQFLTRDPAVAITRDPYGYAGSDPVNAGDPTGLISSVDDYLAGDMKTRISIASEWTGYVGAAAAVGLLLVGTGGTAAPALAATAGLFGNISVATGSVYAGWECLDSAFDATCGVALADMAIAGGSAYQAGTWGKAILAQNSSTLTRNRIEYAFASSITSIIIIGRQELQRHLDSQAKDCL